MAQIELSKSSFLVTKVVKILDFQGWNEITHAIKVATQLQAKWLTWARPYSCNRKHGPPHDLSSEKSFILW